MNLFFKLIISATLYHIISYSSVVCRISDKRKCANADCSVPISLATTLLRYNADDERLLSFPRNAKVRIFSKEAGHNPNFWEAEESSNKCMNYQGSLEYFLNLCQEMINGKRGYVPKGLLRENKVLVPSSKLTHIVPTEYIDKPKENVTKNDLKKEVHNLDNQLSATPKLPVANSKGLFSMIGGVSADSVPINSPDIKPQSTKKFQVLDGTTIYDVENEKQENPPSIIEDSTTEKPGSQSQPLDIKKSPSISIVPSAKEEQPMTEVPNKNEEEGATEKIKENDLDQAHIKEENTMEQNIMNDIGEIQPDISATGSTSGSSIFDNLVNTVQSIMSSGVGESETEEELEGEEEEDQDEEGSAEEEEEREDNGEETVVTGIASVAEKESGNGPQPSKLPDKQSDSKEKSVPLNINDIVNENQSSDSKQDEVIQSETNQGANEGKIENESLSDENAPKKIEETAEIETKVKIGDIEVSGDAEGKVGTNQYNLSSKREEKNVYLDHHQLVSSDVTVSETLKTETSRDLDSSKDEKLQLPKAEISASEATNVFNQPLKHVKVELPLEEQKISSKEVLLESKEKETIASPIIDNIVEPTEADVKTMSDQIKTDTRNEELKVPEQLETVENSLNVDQTTRQLLFGGRQTDEGSSEQLGSASNETLLSSDLKDEITTQPEQLNVTSPEDSLTSPDRSYSAFPNLQPVGSPKYSSVVSRRIQGSDTPVNDEEDDDELLPQSEEDEESKPLPDHINYSSSDSTPLQDGVTVPPNILLQSHSPKYSSVISKRIGSDTSADERSEKLEGKTLEEIVTSEYLEPPSVPEAMSQEESELKEELVEEDKEVPLQEVLPPKPSDDIVVPDASVVDEPEVKVIPVETSEGIYSWIISFTDMFGSSDSGNIGTEEVSMTESLAHTESLDSSRTTYVGDETCSADGVGEGACQTLRDAVQKQVTWQESFYASEMSWPWDKVPLEATIWLIITAVVVLIFSLGHYYIEAHRRDGPLVAIINKLEREVLILKKESCIMEDRLQIAQQQLEAWNTSSSENDALIVELRQDLEETKAAKAEFEEQVILLKEELESVTESGLEMHRLLEESLSSQDGSQVLLSTVETLREKLQRQEDEISGLSHSLRTKNTEVEELQDKLAQSAEVARSLEDKIISITREKEEEVLQLRNKHRELISQLEEEMETKALEETRVSTEMSKLRLNIEELQKILAGKDSELDTLKEVVKQLRSTDSNEKMDALFDVVGIQAKLKTAVAERDEFREKFMEEEGARKLLEGHMKKITQEVADLKNSFETAEKEKIEALTKLQVLSNYFKEKESQLQKELGLQESMWLQKQSDDHTIYEQMRSLREENDKYKLQNESLKKEIVEQESSFKIQLANTEQKAHENWVASRQAERRLKEVQQEASQLRNRLTMVEKNTANYSLDEKQNISESNGDPSSPPPSLMFPPTTSPPFMMYGPPMPPPGDFVPPPPLMGSPYPSDSRPPPLGRISSPPLDHRFSPPPPLPYPPYDYPPYGHHSPSPPPPLPSHHRNVHKPQPREMSREQKDHVPNYSPEAEKTTRRNKR